MTLGLNSWKGGSPMNRLVILAACGTVGWFGFALQAPAITIDGVADAEYGAALAVQDTPTGFGDNFTELDAAYGLLDGGGNLSLMLTGNMENNGNGFVIMIDSRAGGAVASMVDGVYGRIGSIGGDKTDDWGVDTDGSAGMTTPPNIGSILDPDFNPDM